MSLTLPAELARAVREKFPRINYSKVLRDGLQAMLGCRHERLACVHCGNVETRWGLVGAELRQFLGDVLWSDLVGLVDAGGTAEGAARLIRERAIRLGLPGAEALPVPKATRRTREWIRAELRREVRAEVRAELEEEVRAEFIGALEGSGAVRAWTDLGRALEARGGWAFVLNEDAIPMWESTDYAGVWATVEKHLGRPPTFDLHHVEQGPWLDDEGVVCQDGPWLNDDGSVCEDGSVTVVWEHATAA